MRIASRINNFFISPKNLDKIKKVYELEDRAEIIIPIWDVRYDDLEGNQIFAHQYFTINHWSKWYTLSLEVRKVHFDYTLKNYTLDSVLECLKDALEKVQKISQKFLFKEYIYPPVLYAYLKGDIDLSEVHTQEPVCVSQWDLLKQLRVDLPSKCYVVVATPYPGEKISVITELKESSFESEIKYKLINPSQFDEIEKSRRDSIYSVSDWYRYKGEEVAGILKTITNYNKNGGWSTSHELTIYVPPNYWVIKQRR